MVCRWMPRGGRRRESAGRGKAEYSAEGARILSFPDGLCLN